MSLVKREPDPTRGWPPNKFVPEKSNKYSAAETGDAATAIAAANPKATFLTQDSLPLASASCGTFDMGRYVSIS